MNLRIGIPLVQYVFNGQNGWIAGFYYIKNCLNALATLPNDQKPEVFVFAPDNFSEQLLLPEYSDDNQWLKIIKVHTDQSGFSTELQKHIDANPCDIYFPFNNIPTFTFKSAMIGWIPDFQYKHFPDFFSEEDRNNRDLTANFILEQSNAIICSSHRVAQDIQEFYPGNVNKTSVVEFKSLISKSSLTANTNKILKKYKIDRKYIYLPNQFWAHKNHKIVFEAWSHLKSKGHDYLLVCTGGTSDYRKADHFSSLQTYIKDNKLENNIKILGFIDREEQIQLFRNSCAVIQPSLFEGWNTSIEDAKALGKKLFVSNISVHREQCADDTYFFDKNDSIALSDLIRNTWNKLPDGYDNITENNALTNYHTEILVFGEKLLKAFHSVRIINVLQPNKLRNLTLKINSDLQIAQANLVERLDAINNIHEEAAERLKQIKYLTEQNNARLKIIETQDRILRENKIQIKANFNLIHKLRQKINNQHDLINTTKESFDTNLTSLFEQFQSNHSNQELFTNIKTIISDLQDKYELITQYYYTLTEQQHKELLMLHKRTLKARFQMLYRRLGAFRRFKDRLLTIKLGELRLHRPIPLVLPKHYNKNVANKKLPTISIVTPSYNQGEFLARTIKSILEQKYPNLEYVIQDGNSSDNTLDVINQYQSSLLHWESIADKGQSNAINLGFSHTTGEIMGYINSDDLSLPGTLHYIGKFFQNNPNIDVVYGHRILIDENDREIGRWVLPPHDSMILSWADYVPQETLFWRRSIWDKAGGKIDESFNFAMDWDLIIRFREAGAKFARLPRFLGAFRVHQHQKTSSQISNTGIQEMQRLRERCHGRAVSMEEIAKHTKSYLNRHAIFHKLYKAGVLRY